MSTLRITALGRFQRPKPAKRRLTSATVVLAVLSALVAGPTLALDLEKFSGLSGPLVAALTQLASLTPGLKAIIGFISFSVAFISLAGLRNLGPVLFYIGVMIFGAVGLLVGGAIMGAVV